MYTLAYTSTYVHVNTIHANERKRMEEAGRGRRANAQPAKVGDRRAVGELRRDDVVSVQRRVEPQRAKR